MIIIFPSFFICTFVQVPIGARFIGIPGTETAENPRGMMVEVFWEQDESGALCISGNSDETPIPPHVQAQEPSPLTSRRSFSGRSRGVIRGFVIDPNEI